MGALFAWIMRGLAYAGPAAIGYFFNDAATWVASLFPSANVKDKSGNYVWWFVVAIFVAAGAVVLFVLKTIGGKKIKI